MNDKMIMRVEAIKRENVDIEIDEIDAFKVLCKTLHMDFMLDDNKHIYAAEDTNTGEIVVVKDDKVIDDRGKLYIALCAVAECIVPNCELRNQKIVKTEVVNDELL